VRVNGEDGVDAITLDEVVEQSHRLRPFPSPDKK
jgi:hypothetical protein